MALPGSAGMDSVGAAGRPACGRAWQARQKPPCASGAGNSSPTEPKCTVRSPSGEQITVAIPALAAWARHSAGASTVCTRSKAAIRRARRVAGRFTGGCLIRWLGDAKRRPDAGKACVARSAHSKTDSSKSRPARTYLFSVAIPLSEPNQALARKTKNTRTKESIAVVRFPQDYYRLPRE